MAQPNYVVAMDAEDHAEHAPLDKNVVVETVPALRIVLVANVGMTVAEETPVDLVLTAKHATMVCVSEQESELVEIEFVVTTELVDPAVLAHPVKDAEEEPVSASMIVMRETVDQPSWMLDLFAPHKPVVPALQVLLAVPQDNVLHLHLVMLILLWSIRFPT